MTATEDSCLVPDEKRASPQQSTSNPVAYPPPGRAEQRQQQEGTSHWQQLLDVGSNRLGHHGLDNPSLHAPQPDCLGAWGKFTVPATTYVAQGEARGGPRPIAVARRQLAGMLTEERPGPGLFRRRLAAHCVRSCCTFAAHGLFGLAAPPPPFSIRVAHTHRACPIVCRGQPNQSTSLD